MDRRAVGAAGQKGGRGAEKQRGRPQQNGAGEGLAGAANDLAEDQDALRRYGMIIPTCAR